MYPCFVISPTNFSISTIFCLSSLSLFDIFYSSEFVPASFVLTPAMEDLESSSNLYVSGSLLSDFLSEYREAWTSKPCP